MIAIPQLGFDVVLANSGSEALKRLSEGTFACVLLDVRMPGIDGFETAALIRKRESWKDLPILFMTSAEPSLLDYTLGYSLGAVDFIARPLVSEIIKGKVNAITQLLLFGTAGGQRFQGADRVAAGTGMPRPVPGEAGSRPVLRDLGL